MAPQIRPPIPYLIFPSTSAFIDHTSNNSIVLVTSLVLPLFRSFKSSVFARLHAIIHALKNKKPRHIIMDRAWKSLFTSLYGKDNYSIFLVNQYVD
jgi:hypothetical protein